MFSAVMLIRCLPFHVRLASLPSSHTLFDIRVCARMVEKKVSVLKEKKRRKKKSSVWFVKIERDRQAARSPRHSLPAEDRRRGGGREREVRVKAKNFAACPACRFARINQSTNQKYKPELLSSPRTPFVCSLFVYGCCAAVPCK